MVILPSAISTQRNQTSTTNSQLNTETKDIPSVAAHANQALLSVENLTCTRSDIPLFSNLSFSLDKSQSLRILGTNGSGKTTLIRTMAGIHEPVMGQVHWNIGQESSSGFASKPKIAYVGHTTGLRGELTALENLEFHARINGNLSGISPTECLEKMNVAHCSKLPCIRLSAGQRQRVALSRLSLNQYDLWLLDEPATSLDDQGIDLLLDLAGYHLNAGGMIIYCSHQSFHSGLKHDREIDLQNFKEEHPQC